MLLLTLGLSVAWLAPTALAVDVLDPVCNGNGAAVTGSAVCRDDRSDGSNPIFGPDGILTTVMTWLARFVGVAAVIGIIVAGFMMITANGDSGNAATARRALLYSIIGLAVAALAQTIVSFVLKRL